MLCIYHALLDTVFRIRTVITRSLGTSSENFIELKLRIIARRALDYDITCSGRAIISLRACISIFCWETCALTTEETTITNICENCIRSGLRLTIKTLGTWGCRLHTCACRTYLTISTSDSLRNVIETFSITDSSRWTFKAFELISSSSFKIESSSGTCQAHITLNNWSVHA